MLRLAKFWAKLHGLLHILALPVLINCFGIKLTKAAFGWAQSKMKTKKYAIISNNTGKADMIIIFNNIFHLQLDIIEAKSNDCPQGPLDH